MLDKSFRYRIAWLFTFALFCVTSTVFAQYQVRHWTPFEEGKIPDDVYWFGNNPEQLMEAVDIGKLQSMPAEFKQREIGKFVLKIKAQPNPENAKSYNQGLVAKQIVNRDELGENGRALYQVDFFLTPDIPSLAVLAFEGSEDNLPAAGEKVISPKTGFYRFGMTLGKTLYFSYFAPGNEKALIFLQDKELLANIPKPGWHRFQIVCQGPNDIYCYVDGRQTSFSPVTEPTMRKLMVGVMLADNARTYDAYCDNISIQTSNEAPNLPDSPYQTGWTVAATSAASSGATGSASTGGSTATPATASSTQGSSGGDAGPWLDPVGAWEKAKSDKVPFLIYFYAPGIPGTQRMDELFATDAAAKDFLSKRAGAKVDVNQLDGGTLAQKYNIFKVPTLLEFSSDGKKVRTATFNKGDDWAAVQRKLDANK